eukprot:UN20040
MFQKFCPYFGCFFPCFFLFINHSIKLVPLIWCFYLIEICVFCHFLIPLLFSYQEPTDTDADHLG